MKIAGMFSVTFINASPKKCPYTGWADQRTTCAGKRRTWRLLWHQYISGPQVLLAETVHSDDDEPKPLLKFSVDRRRQKYTYGGRKKGKGAENDSNGGVFDYLRNLL